jgi:hypothetical protein
MGQLQAGVHDTNNNNDDYVTYQSYVVSVNCTTIATPTRIAVCRDDIRVFTATISALIANFQHFVTVRIRTNDLISHNQVI